MNKGKRLLIASLPSQLADLPYKYHIFMAPTIYGWREQKVEVEARKIIMCKSVERISNGKWQAHQRAERSERGKKNR